MDCHLCSLNEEHTLARCTVSASALAVKQWDRTRWDRLQTVALLASLAAVPSPLLWAILVALHITR